MVGGASLPPRISRKHGQETSQALACFKYHHCYDYDKLHNYYDGLHDDYDDEYDDYDDES